MPHSSTPFPPQLSAVTVEKAVRGALEEDLGLAGDLTSQATLPPHANATALMNTREDGVIAGLSLATAAFAQIGTDANGKALVFEPLVIDGAHVRIGDAIARISGNARLLMSAERVALNFLNHLSGIATHTRRFVDAAGPKGAQICDTRKTTPGLRAFEKYAVRCGGGSNHRFGLDDAILIKDNHIAVSGSVGAAIRAAQNFAGHLVVIEVEVDSLEQLDEALAAGASTILLDNMSNEKLNKAVEINAGRAKLEASGGVDLERVAGIAATGIDYISTSNITMASVPLDIGLDIEIDV